MAWLGLLEVRNIDLPRKVRFRSRRKGTTVYKVDKNCLTGRTHEDVYKRQALMIANGSFILW